jgi:outer membrane protein assembly factor BamB
MSAPVTTQSSRSAWWKSLRRAAKIAGWFCLAVWLGLLVQHFVIKRHDPLKSRELTVLKEQLRAAPQNAQVKEQIRTLDLELRRRYFRYLAVTDTGAWLLLAGGIGFLIAAKRFGALTFVPFLPPRKSDDVKRVSDSASRARRAVAFTSALALTALITLAFSVRTKLPTTTAGVEKLLGAESVPAVADCASREEFLRNWPQFRGPLGTAASSDTNPPAIFDASMLLWKAPTLAPGFNSPIVWGNRVFFSGGDAKTREVFCHNAETGALLWRHRVEVPSQSHPEISESTGWAAPTMATDGRRVYAIFGNNDFAAFTLDGQLVWAKNLGPSKNSYGHAASLAVWCDRVIVQLDQGDEEDHLSKVYAFDGPTGSVVWQRSRPVAASWSSPIVVEVAAKPQVIALAPPWVISYSANDGAELWRCDGMSGEVTPSPAFAAGLVLAPSPSDKILAIRGDCVGDVTKTHVAWTNEDNVPDITSPAVTEELMFTLNTSGLLTCVDVKTGRKLWDHDFLTEFHASPAIAAGRVYLFAKDGKAFVVEAGRQFRELSRGELNDSIAASPAFAQNRIFIRGETNVFCFGNAVGQVAGKQK